MQPILIIACVLCAAVAVTAGGPPPGILGGEAEPDRTGRVFDIVADLTVATEKLEQQRHAILARGTRTSSRGDQISVSETIFLSVKEPSRLASLEASAFVIQSSSGAPVEKWQQEISVGTKQLNRITFGGRTLVADPTKVRPGEPMPDYTAKVVYFRPIQASISRLSAFSDKGASKDKITDLFLDRAELVDAHYTKNGDIESRWTYEAGNRIPRVVEVEMLFGKQQGFMPVEVKYYSSYRTPDGQLGKRGLRSHCRTDWKKRGDLYLPIRLFGTNFSLDSRNRAEIHYDILIETKLEKELTQGKLIDPSLVDWREPLRSVFDADWEPCREDRVLLQNLKLVLPE